MDDAGPLTVGIWTAALPEVALIRHGTAGAQAVASGPGQALESLITLLEHALRELRSAAKDITRVAVCTGPGSFTGLRIGVAFANAFAQARGLPIVGVSTYDVAEFELTAFPRISVAEGKRDHYYARVRLAPKATPEYSHGDRAHVQRLIDAIRAASGRAPVVAGSAFAPMAAGEGARRVALLSMAREAEGAQERETAHGRDTRWTGAVIDYGQRPDAVVTFEKRNAAG